MMTLYKILGFPLYAIGVTLGLILRPVIMGFCQGLLIIETALLKQKLLRREKILKKHLAEKEKMVDKPET